MINHFGIHIKVKNIENSYKFYKNFGFKELFAYGDKKFLSQFKKPMPTAPEKYRGVVFAEGIEIADGHLAVKPQIFKERITSSKVSSVLQVGSLKSVLAVCKKNKYKIAVPPKVYPWGTREVVIKDPDGFVLVFVEKIK